MTRGPPASVISRDFTALQQAAEFGFLLGRDVANQDKLPDWRPGEAFKR